MSQTHNLHLPVLAAEQAQKHVTLNEALRALDAVVQLAVKDRHLAAPPGAPAEGDRYIVAAGPTGGWAGHAGDVAAWQDGTWTFYDPREGWLAWVADEDLLVAWDGAAWMTAGGGGGGGGSELQNLTLLGVGTAADAANPFSAKLNKALWTAKPAAEGGDGDLRYTMSKESSADVLSLLFQSGFSGRAEFGLIGDDNLACKVSADGATWKTALVLDRTTGRVSFPSGGAREVLAANRTYYVRQDGSDANAGLADTAGGAFLTIARALTVAKALDLNGFALTIQVGAGTWTVPVTLVNLLGGNGTILGDEATPANVTLNVAGSAFVAPGLTTTWDIRGFKLVASSYGIHSFGGSRVNFQSLDYGACSTHIAAFGGFVTATGPYKITAGASYHWSCLSQGAINVAGRTITITGTPAFSAAFASVDGVSTAAVSGNTFSGSATGKRYSATMNGIIQTFGGGAAYLPGDVAGTFATGGQYA